MRSRRTLTFRAQFVFAVLVLASQVGSFDGETSALFEGVRAKVNTVLVQQFKEKGAWATLVALLRDGSAVGKEEAAGALWGLAVNTDNQVAIAKEKGALATLVALLRDGSAVGKEITRRAHCGACPGSQRSRTPSSNFGLPCERSCVAISNTHDMPPHATRHTLTLTKGNPRSLSWPCRRVYLWRNRVF